MADTQIGQWLRAKSELKTAEALLRNILLDTQRLAKSLEQWRSIQPDGPGVRYPGTKDSFEPDTWPDWRAVNAALRACHEAQQKFSQADDALTPQDRKLLEPD